MPALIRALLVLSLGLSSCQADRPTIAQGSQPAAQIARETKEAKETQVFRNVYSRPNDDTFQNATGNAGEPYEVARIQCALVAEGDAEGFDITFDWNAEMTTGRHVEAGNFFFLTDIHLSLLI